MFVDDVLGVLPPEIVAFVHQMKTTSIALQIVRSATVSNGTQSISPGDITKDLKLAECYSCIKDFVHARNTLDERRNNGMSTCLKPHRRVKLCL